MNPLETTVGWIGTGIMGRPMALNLVKKGFRLNVHNRTPEKARAVVEAGGVWKASPREVAEASDVIVTIVTDTPDVEAVLFGDRGVIHGVRAGQTLIDMSTISPGATREFAARLAGRGVDMLDAPVSGGEVGAVRGTLTIMVGGEPEVFERCRPVLEAVGTRITRVGKTGSGQVVKACNQVLCAVNQIAVSEALSLCHRAGIDLDAMHRVVTGGAGNSWALETLGRKVIDGDLKPAFMVRLIQKDLNIVSELAGRLGLPLPGTSLAVQLFRAVEAEEGGGDLGTQAMIQAYERLGNFRLPR